MVHSPERKTGRSITTDVRSKGDHSANGLTNGDSLTKTHKEILHFLEQGYTKTETAGRMGLSVHTLDMHLREIYRIVNVHSMTAAVAKAIRERMI